MAEPRGGEEQPIAGTKGPPSVIEEPCDEASDRLTELEVVPPEAISTGIPVSYSPQRSPDGNVIAATKDQRKTEKKKRSSWYNMLSPNYKSRSDDLKRLFKDLPDTERLLVDYSCAVQRDILVHGRLYVTQNYLCFHANILRWETYLSIRCKDITAITKEKTALVIPNAIQVVTAAEKFFFTSFASRDKAYLMLFRVWQNALLDQAMTSVELWQAVHEIYGDDLGLTSDDDDYVNPNMNPEEGGRLQYLDPQLSDHSVSSTSNKSHSRKPSQESCTTHSRQSSQGQDNFRMNPSIMSSVIGDMSGDSDITTSSGRSGGVGDESYTPTAGLLAAPSAFVNGGQSNCPTSALQLSISAPVTPATTSATASPCSPMGLIPNDDASGGPAMSSTPPKASSSSSSKLNGAASKSSKSDKYDRREAKEQKKIVNGIDTKKLDKSLRKMESEDSSESDYEADSGQVTCPCTNHEGRLVLNAVYDVSVDQLFGMLFSESPFYSQFQEIRKTTDIVYSDWQFNKEAGHQLRQLTYTLSLNLTVGPKTTQATETQIMAKSSKPGHVYVIDVDAVTNGVPYGENFYTHHRHCLSRISEHQTRYMVHSEVKYRKSTWGFVKSFIEKNTMQAVEEYYQELDASIQKDLREPMSSQAPTKKSRVPRRRHKKPSEAKSDLPSPHAPHAIGHSVYTQISNWRSGSVSTGGMGLPISDLAQRPSEWIVRIVLVVLVLLLFINALLYYKLWSLEEHTSGRTMFQVAGFDFDKMKKPQTEEEWMKILKQQLALHRSEISKWQDTINTAVKLIQQTEAALLSLQSNVPSSPSHR